MNNLNANTVGDAMEGRGTTTTTPVACEYNVVAVDFSEHLIVQPIFCRYLIRMCLNIVHPNKRINGTDFVIELFLLPYTLAVDPGSISNL